MKIPLTVLFFPGVVLHELSHVLACAVTGVKVHQVKWFGTTEAFVQHDKPHAISGLVISLAPLLINNFLGFFLLKAASKAVPEEPVFAVLAAWAGVSLVLFSFPSKPDAENTFNAFVDSFRKKWAFPKKQWPLTSILTWLFWLVLTPFVFIPLILLLGIVLVFDYVFAFRVLWLIGVLTLVLA